MSKGILEYQIFVYSVVFAYTVHHSHPQKRRSADWGGTGSFWCYWPLWMWSTTALLCLHFINLSLTQQSNSWMELEGRARYNLMCIILSPKKKIFTHTLHACTHSHALLYT